MKRKDVLNFIRVVPVGDNSFLFFLLQTGSPSGTQKLYPTCIFFLFQQGLSERTLRLNNRHLVPAGSSPRDPAGTIRMYIYQINMPRSGYLFVENHHIGFAPSRGYPSDKPKTAVFLWSITLLRRIAQPVALFLIFRTLVG